MVIILGGALEGNLKVVTALLKKVTSCSSCTVVTPYQSGHLDRVTASEDYAEQFLSECEQMMAVGSSIDAQKDWEGVVLMNADIGACFLLPGTLLLPNHEPFTPSLGSEKIARHEEKAHVRLSAQLYQIIEGLGYAPECFACGTSARFCAETITALSSDAIQSGSTRAERQASIVLFDRTLDYVEPLLYTDSLGTKVLEQFPSWGKYSCDIQVPPELLTEADYSKGSNEQPNRVGASGSMVTPQSEGGKELLQEVVTRKEKVSGTALCSEIEVLLFDSHKDVHTHTDFMSYDLPQDSLLSIRRGIYGAAARAGIKMKVPSGKVKMKELRPVADALVVCMTLTSFWSNGATSLIPRSSSPPFSLVLFGTYSHKGTITCDSPHDAVLQHTLAAVEVLSQPSLIERWQRVQAIQKVSRERTE